jgi:hypothetical protein
MGGSFNHVFFACSSSLLTYAYCALIVQIAYYKINIKKKKKTIISTENPTVTEPMRKKRKKMKYLIVLTFNQNENIQKVNKEIILQEPTYTVIKKKKIIVVALIIYH